MNTILVTYDLVGHETSEDYARLIREIKAYPEVIHPLYSVWLIRTGWTTTQVRDDLLQWIDDDDKFLVWDVTNRAASWNAALARSDADWIRNTP